MTKMEEDAVTDEAKIEILEDLMDLAKGSLKMETVLTGIDEWDSLSRLFLIVTARKKFKKELTAEELRRFRTVGDICRCLD